MADNIPEGHALVSGRDGRVARKLLHIAAEQGLDSHVVRTAAGGYLVPLSVADAYEGQSTAPAEAVYVDGSTPEIGDDGIPVAIELAPTSDWKNADIADWAKAHDVDLGGATTKADMLAAIAAANEKE